MTLQMHVRVTLRVHYLVDYPAVSGGAIPSRIGQFECRELPVAPALKPNYNDGEE